jgi:hypothetical protein
VWAIADEISNQSTALNTSRITVLKSRNDQLDTLFEDANKKVKELSGKKDYEKSLEALILEVCFSLVPFHIPPRSTQYSTTNTTSICALDTAHQYPLLTYRSSSNSYQRMSPSHTEQKTRNLSRKPPRTLLLDTKTSRVDQSKSSSKAD